MSNSEILSTTHKELDCLVSECSKENWDGYNSSSISLESVEYVKKVISMFPEWLTIAPELSVNSEGNVILDWIKTKTSIFSISVLSNGFIAYSFKNDGQDDLGVYSVINLEYIFTILKKFLNND